MNGTRRLGPYAPLSATYAQDDSVIEAGEAAELLYVRGLAFCATSNSDGYMTRAQVTRHVGAGMRDALKRAERLVDVGLWEAAEGGFQIRAWLKWNRSADDMDRHRTKDRERKSGRKANTTPPEPPTPFRADSARNPDGIPPDSAGNPEGIRADSSRIPSSRASASGRAQAPTQARHFTSLHFTPLQGTAQQPAREPESLDEPAPVGVTAQAAQLVAEHPHPPGRWTDQELHELRRGAATLLASATPPLHVAEGLRRLADRPDAGTGLLRHLAHDAMRGKPAPRPAHDPNAEIYRHDPAQTEHRAEVVPIDEWRRGA